MYLGIDVGGTKTLVAVLDDNGVIVERIKFPTPQDYSVFLETLSSTIDQFQNQDYRAVGVGIPATQLNRDSGIAVSFSHLDWHEVPVQADIERLLSTPVALENDAKLGALSEAMLRKEIPKVLYVTVSTGIGYGLVNHLVMDPNIGDAGGRLMMLEYRGKLIPWEDFASGKAIVETFGKQAHDITDPKAGKQSAVTLAWA